MGLRYYDIDIFNLSYKSHDYEFEFDDAFFAEFEDSLVQKGSGMAKVVLNKSETMINLKIDIEGTVELICDRSLDEFQYPISTSNELILKLGDEWEELSEQIIVIPRDSERINVAQFIYEFIGLAIPMKRLHPRFSDDELSDEPEMIYSSEPDEKNKDEGGSIDPRWSKLKDLK